MEKLKSSLSGSLQDMVSMHLIGVVKMDGGVSHNVAQGHIKVVL